MPASGEAVAIPIATSVEIRGTCMRCGHRIAATFDSQHTRQIYAWYHWATGDEKCP